MKFHGKCKFNPILIHAHFKASTTDSFENIVGKEKIAWNQQFLLFAQCFLLNQKIVSPFVNIFDIISLFAAELEEQKIGMWDKGLTFNDLAHTSGSLNACIYYKISVSIWMIIKKMI